MGCTFSASAKKRPEPCSAAFFYGFSLNSREEEDQGNPGGATKIQTASPGTPPSAHPLAAGKLIDDL